jgi:hypothetical protein
MPLVIAGATSGSTTVQATDAVTATITLPSATDTLVGKATTDTLTNKTLTLPVVGTTIGVGGATPSTSGAGITFPATQSASTNANTLDDYEEGTWTPASPDITYATAVGTYTKIGRVVQWQAYVIFPTTSNTAHARMTGLPYAVQDSENARAGSAITASTYGSAFYCLPVNSGTIVYFYTIATASLLNSNLSGKQVFCGGTYIS